MIDLSKTHKALIELVHNFPSAYKQFETELLQMGDAINRLEKARNDLGSAECTIRVILELLDAADTTYLKASDIHCLLTPLHMKILNTFNHFDEA